MSTLGTLLRKTERRLAQAGIGDARIEADLVWMTALDVGRTELFSRLPDAVTEAESSAAEALIERRLRHEPAAYIMGKREFFGLELTIAPGVLIPRPDTETLVEEALRIAPSLPAGGLRIADVGCGSGAIGIALAASLPHAHVFATDIAPRALEIASSNAERYGLAGRMTFQLGDLLEPVPEPVHLITANLPYVASHEIPTLDPEIRIYEPREALDGGGDGLDVIRRLLDSAAGQLVAGGAMLLEMDPRQIEEATAHARERFDGAIVRAVPDLTGRDRVLVVQTR